MYTLALDSNFAPFLSDDAKWEKKTRTSTYRGLTDDGEEVDAGSRKTKAQKLKLLELMLGQIYGTPKSQKVEKLGFTVVN